MELFRQLFQHQMSFKKSFRQKIFLIEKLFDINGGGIFLNGSFFKCTSTALQEGQTSNLGNEQRMDSGNEQRNERNGGDRANAESLYADHPPINDCFTSNSNSVRGGAPVRKRA